MTFNKITITLYSLKGMDVPFEQVRDTLNYMYKSLIQLFSNVQTYYDENMY